MPFNAIIFFLLLSTVASAQESNSNDSSKQLLPSRLMPVLINQNTQLYKTTFPNFKTYCKPTDNNINSNVLWIVDGMLYYQSQLSKIDPNNIKTMEVLRPPLAVKKYGPTAKDGAIIIHTKK